MKIKYYVLVVLSLSLSAVSAQDFHNTYWQFAPQVVNPAFTGAFYGNLRVNAIGRNQGRPIVSNAVEGESNPLNDGGDEFNDYSIGLDGNIPFGFKKGDWVSAGMSLSSSKAGALGYVRRFQGLNLAYHLTLGKKQNTVFTLGAHYGNYNLGYSGNKDRGVTPYILAGNNNDPDLNELDVDEMGNALLKKNDFMLGFMLTAPMGDNADIRFGLASDHLLAPRFQVNQDTMGGGGVTTTTKRLDRRFNAFIQYYVSLNDKLVFNPTLLYQTTKDASQILLQGIFSFLVNEEKEFTFNAGLGLRLNSSMDVPIFLGADWKDWRFGMSYDTNVTGLSQANSSFGAIEFGVTKIFSWNKKASVKPKFVCPRL